MTGALGMIIGLLIVAAVIYLLIKQYDTRLVLIGAGFAMSILSLNPIIALDAFSKSMVSSGLIQSICSVMGFAFVMKYTEVDKHLIHSLVKGLSKLRFAIIPGATAITFLVNISLTSAAGVTSAVGAVLIPLLMSLGVHPATAASAVILGTFGSCMSPGLSHAPIIAKLANMEVIDIVTTFATPSIISMIIGALALTVIAVVLKEHKGYVLEDYDDSHMQFKVNPLYAILPLFPVAMLIILNITEVQAALPWAKSIKVPHAMIIGAAACLAATRVNPAKATTEFFNGMGKGYGDIIGIIIAAGIFVAGMKSLGMINELIAILQNTNEHVVKVAAVFGPFLLAVLSGSGDAAAIAFNESVTIHAPSFGLEVSNMGVSAALAGALGRAVSPIAGATIVAAALAKVNPLEISKRTALGMFIAAVVLIPVLL